MIETMMNKLLEEMKLDQMKNDLTAVSIMFESMDGSDEITEKEALNEAMNKLREVAINSTGNYYKALGLIVTVASMAALVDDEAKENVSNFKEGIHCLAAEVFEETMKMATNNHKSLMGLVKQQLG
jgi:hypothetical protein